MRPAWVWGAALVIYGAFSLWYNNLGGVLAPAEIDGYLADLESAALDTDPERAATLRAFLEADDGGEFFMLNLIRLHDGPVSVDGSSAQAAERVLEQYTSYVMPEIFRRAGHPVLLGPAAGGYVEHWGVGPDPGWTFAGAIRYRSRRDLMEVATDPAFAPAHAYKLAAMASTLAFPVAPGAVFFGPRVWLALGLALLAALGHLGLAGGASGD